MSYIIPSQNTKYRDMPGPLYQIQFHPGSRTIPRGWKCKCGDHYYRNKDKFVPESKACKHVKCFLDGSAGITPENIHLFTGKGISANIRRLIAEWQIAESRKELTRWQNDPNYIRSSRFKDPLTMRDRIRRDPYLLDSTSGGIGMLEDASMKFNPSYSWWAGREVGQGGKEQTKYYTTDIEEMGMWPYNN